MASRIHCHKKLDWLNFKLSILSKQNSWRSLLHVVSSMEDLGRRFPLISQIILNNIDNISLARFREASRENDNFLNSETFYWIRNIKKYSANFEEFQQPWKKVINKTPVEFLKNLAIDMHSFFNKISTWHNIQYRSWNQKNVLNNFWMCF